MDVEVKEFGRNAYHDAIFRLRAARLKKLRGKGGGAKQFRLLRQYYRKGHIDDMVNDWGITADPRMVRLGKRAVMPFELYPKQREWIKWTFQNWLDGEYGLTEKSRDVGASWMAVAFSDSIGALFDDITIGLGSYKQEKVDNGADPGSLFWKARTYLDWLPVEFRAGFRLNENSRERRIEFPNTGSIIIGEIGDNIGRGGRTGIYFVDETAHLEHDALVDAGLSANTDCRQDMSSVFGMQNSFATRRHQAGTRVFIFDWRHDPRKDQAWYEKFLSKWGPVITAQEVDRNYSASLEGILIPAKWVEAMVDAHLKLNLLPKGAKSGALDVADTGMDKNAYCGRHGCLITHLSEWSGKQPVDIYATTEHAFNLCDLHGETSFVYDGDGLGAGVRGDARKVNEDRRKHQRRQIDVGAFRASDGVLRPEAEDTIEGVKNKDFFGNFKAQSWWHLRSLAEETYRAVVERKPYDADKIVSINGDIPQDTLIQVKLELSQPIYEQNKQGLIYIQKTPEGRRSPNLADAVMMAFAPRKGGIKINTELLRKLRRANRVPSRA